MDSPLISKKFSLAHVEFNELAVRHGLENKLPSQYVPNAELIGSILDEVETPFVITSWYRGLALEREYSRKQFAEYCIANRRPFNDDSWVEFHTQSPHSRAAAVCLMSQDIAGLVQSLDGLGVVEYFGAVTGWVSFALEEEQ